MIKREDLITGNFNYGANINLDRFDKFLKNSVLNNKWKVNIISEKPLNIVTIKSILDFGYTLICCKVNNIKEAHDFYWSAPTYRESLGDCEEHIFTYRLSEEQLLNFEVKYPEVIKKRILDKGYYTIDLLRNE